MHQQHTQVVGYYQQRGMGNNRYRKDERRNKNSDRNRNQKQRDESNKKKADHKEGCADHKGSDNKRREQPNKKESAKGNVRFDQKSRKHMKLSEESSSDAGVFPIFVPTEHGLVPRFVSSSGMHLINTMSEKFEKDLSTSNYSEETDEAKSGAESTSTRSRQTYFEERNFSTSEDDKRIQKKGKTLAFH